MRAGEGGCWAKVSRRNKDKEVHLKALPLGGEGALRRLCEAWGVVGEKEEEEGDIRGGRGAALMMSRGTYSISAQPCLSGLGARSCGGGGGGY